MIDGYWLFGCGKLGSCFEDAYTGFHWKLFHRFRMYWAVDTYCRLRFGGYSSASQSELTDRRVSSKCSNDDFDVILVDSRRFR